MDAESKKVIAHCIRCGKEIVKGEAYYTNGPYCVSCNEIQDETRRNTEPRGN